MSEQVAFWSGQETCLAISLTGLVNLEYYVKSCLYCRTKLKGDCRFVQSRKILVLFSKLHYQRETSHDVVPGFIHNLLLKIIMKI